LVSLIVGSIQVMTASVTRESDIDALRGDVAALKDDVGRLIDHLKGGARSSVLAAAGQFNGQVRGLSEGASAQGERTVRALGAWVEEEPVLAVLIALGVGYVGARLLSR
jgi:ElaB/YqjD/DUF883 family membrane-anchored ribosome-binding protein